MIGYREIERRLQSFSDRTNLTIIFSGEKYEYTRRNSEYASHRGLNITPGHGISSLVILGDPSRDGTGILLVHGEPEMVTVSGDVVTRRLPASALNLLSLLQWPATRPNWISGLVNVSYPDTFSGYNDEGHPLFEKYPIVVAGDKTILDSRPAITFLGTKYYAGDVVIAATTEASDALQVATYNAGLAVRPLNADEADHRWVICTKREYNDYLAEMAAKNDVPF